LITFAAGVAAEAPGAGSSDATLASSATGTLALVCLEIRAMPIRPSYQRSPKSSITELKLPCVKPGGVSQSVKGAFVQNWAFSDPTTSPARS
jgi:hypothetical protein